MPAVRLRIFVSSVQKEFSQIRKDLKAFLLGDAVLRRFVAEVWNPGTLPGTLTLESLHGDHPSVPFNPLIAESLYLTRYIEKAGSGTQRMIELCREAGLPEPDYELRQGSFVLTIWKDWLTEETMGARGLTERQRKAVVHTKVMGRITNTDYQKLAGVIRKTAARDLGELVAQGILESIGSKRGTYYVVAKKK